MGARQPGMERIQRTFDGNTQSHQPHYHSQWDCILAGSHQLLDGILQRHHQQMTRNAIEHGKSHQEQTGAQQAHNQITNGSHDSFAGILGHNNGTGHQGIDFNKDVSGKHIVGVDQSQQRTE